MVDISILFGVVLFADAIAVVVLLWTETFTRYEGVVLWEEESPIAPLFWGSVIVLVAGVLSLIDVPLAGQPVVRVNVGGVIAPLAVCVLILWRRKPELISLIVAIVGTVAATLAATAVSPETFALAFPWNFLPAAVAGTLAVALARNHPAQSLDLSYVGAVVGCLVGLDLIPFAVALRSPSGAPDVTFGAGGILDLVFLSGVFAVAIAWAAGFVRALFARGPPRPLAAEPGEPDALRREYEAGRGVR